jgi:hypothetical protein
MSAARALARAQAAGLRLCLRPDGGVRVEADAPPPAEVLADLRRWRDDIARMLAAQDRQPEADNGDDPERQALAAYYGEPPRARPYRPTDPDPLRGGVLVSAPPLDAEGLPFAACPACGGGLFWKPADLPPEGPGWRCEACHPPPAEGWRHACAVPTAWS